jgi:UDP-N-acetylmuramate--alanine ligase
MAPSPPTMARPHFIGVGGAGMSGIAKILTQRGVLVAGSDIRDSDSVRALRELGATVHLGHDREHLAADASCVVISSAIRDSNPELAAARERGIPVLHRSEALAAVMEGRRAIAVAGTHGKTTTTSMLAVGLRTLGLDPGYAIGGDLDHPGSNAEHGSGPVFVAEADESDRSFHRYAPEVAIILNAELDHHANYASLEEIYQSFEDFVDTVRPGGTLVIDADHVGTRELTARLAARRHDEEKGDGGGGRDLRIITYGAAPEADARVLAVEPKGLTSEVTVSLEGRELAFTVSVPGRHYAHNAVAALVAGASVGVPADQLSAALSSYTGVARRLQLKGEARGVQIIDSYAHHPTEMTADLEALRGSSGGGGVYVVFQPHLYSRTQELGAEMGQALALADASVVLDIYPAREDPIPGVSSELIIDSARLAGAVVHPEHNEGAVPELISTMVSAGDLVITMGAGDVTDLGPRILHHLETGG